MGAEPGTLAPGEVHPAAPVAADFLRSLGPVHLTQWLETFSSCALEGNRAAEVCAETMRRFLAGEPVSDRYLLGLAFTIAEMQP